MMFRVEWTQSALNELANVWLLAGPGQRTAVTRAATEIERRLQADPLNESDSRPVGRVIIELPLGATIGVDAAGSLVTVVHVWLIRYRPRTP